MTWTSSQFTWVIIGVVTYALVTAVLAILAQHAARSIAIHDRIRDSKNLRQQYLDALKKRQGG